MLLPFIAVYDGLNPGHGSGPGVQKLGEAAADRLFLHKLRREIDMTVSAPELPLGEQLVDGRGTFVPRASRLLLNFRQIELFGEADVTAEAGVDQDLFCKSLDPKVRIRGKAKTGGDGLAFIEGEAVDPVGDIRV